MIKERSWGSKVFDIVNYFLLFAFAVVCLAPFIHVLAVSLSDRAAASGGLVLFWPVRFTTTSYQKILSAGSFMNAFIVSIERTILGTSLQMILTVLTAYPLSKTQREVPGRNIMMWIVLFAMLFSGGLIPRFLVVRSLGMLNKLWALIIPNALPIWNTILMMNFFRELPIELEESAIIDGASYWEVLYHILLPLSVPGLATLTLFCAVNHWNAWFDGMIYIMDRTRIPLQTFLRQIVINLDMSEILRDPRDYMLFSDRSIRGAQILLTIVPILIVYPFLQKYFVTGLKLGAVKG